MLTDCCDDQISFDIIDVPPHTLFEAIRQNPTQLRGNPPVKYTVGGDRDKTERLVHFSFILYVSTKIA